MIAPEKMAELLAKMREINDPQIFDGMEMRVTLDVCLGDEDLRWMSMRASPEVVAGFVKGLLPAMEQIKPAMQVMAKAAKV